MRNLSKEILFCTAIVSGAVVFFIIGMGPIRAQGPPNFQSGSAIRGNSSADWDPE
jgi:multisubunit Na+/H+ antiporter MnhC subunit